jgi:hypothetical protein
MKLLKNEWNIKPLKLDNAKDFISEHHYAKGAGDLATACYGLYFHSDPHTLHGVAVWNPPAYGAAIKANQDHRGVISLTRFCLVEDRPENAGSFLISGSIGKLNKRYHTLLTYADTALNHNGGLYRASNWSYDGLTNKAPRWWCPTEERLVTQKRGKVTYNKQEMLEMGYEYLGRFQMHKYLYPRFNRKNLIITPKAKQPDYIQTSLAFTKNGKILRNE